MRMFGDGERAARHHPHPRSYALVLPFPHSDHLLRRLGDRSDSVKRCRALAGARVAKSDQRVPVREREPLNPEYPTPGDTENSAWEAVE